MKTAFLAPNAALDDFAPLGGEARSLLPVEVPAPAARGVDAAPTVLSVGDIAFTAMQTETNGNGTADYFQFVLLTPVTAGTTIYFTDNGYLNATDRFRTNESMLRWVAQTDLPAHSLISFNVANGGGSFPSTAEWTGINPVNGAIVSIAQMSLDTGGDQITAIINPVYGGAEHLGGTSIAGVSIGAYLSNFTTTTSNNAHESALPLGLTVGSTTVELLPPQGTQDYNDAVYRGAITGTDAAAVRAAVNTAASWAQAKAPFTNQAFTPTFQFSAAGVSQNEGNGGTTDFVFTVTRTYDLGAASVAWSIAGSGTNPATATDFAGGVLPAGGTVTFADGVTTATITISVAGDTTIEPNETFILSLATLSGGYTLGTQTTSIGTIVNDDVPDTTAPLLVSSSPADNGTGAGIGSPIVLTFNEAVKAGAGSITLHPATGADVVIPITSGQVVFNGTTVTITPTANLRPNVAYDVIIPSGVIADTAGNPFAGIAQDALDFTTSSDIPGGTQAQSFIVTDPGTYTLAQGAPRTQTAGVAVSVTATTGPVSLVINDEIDGPAGSRVINFANNPIIGSISIGRDAGTVQSLSQDAIRIQGTRSTIDLDNQGVIIAAATPFTPTVGGTNPGSGFAIDYTAVLGATGAASTDRTSGGVITNGSTTNAVALIGSDNGDAIRLGSHQTLNNYGQIIGAGDVNDASSNNVFNGANGNPNTSTAQTYDISRGVRLNQANGTAVTINNYNLIQGAQHGVDVGQATVTGLVVNNAAGALIVGKNGSGVGSDTTGAAADTVTVINSGTIRGEYAGVGHIYDRAGYASVDGDGDGVDIDGGATITNLAGATISGTGAGGFDSNGRANASEGISIGGGIIINQGAIAGAQAGIVVNNDSVASRSGIAATTITNYAGGTITGQTSYAIRLENKLGTAADNDSITNYGTITGNGIVPSGAVLLQDNSADPNSVGTLDGVTYTAADAGNARFIRGDGAAVQMGEGNDTFTNYGMITGGSGRAINMEGGDDILTLYTGSTITGRMDGGAGADNLELYLDDRPASGGGDAGNNSNVASGTISNVINFESLRVVSGTWFLSDTQSYVAGITIVNGADLVARASLVGDIINSGLLEANAQSGGDLTISGAISGPGAFYKEGAGVVTLSASSTFASGVNLFEGTLRLTTAGAAGTGAVHFYAGAQTLALTSAALGADAGHSFGNAITGFGAEDHIDLIGPAAARSTASYDATTGSLVVTDLSSGSTVATINVGTGFGAYAISLADDGHGGTDVSFVANDNGGGGGTGFAGTAGADRYIGTSANDLVNFSQGGADAAFGGAGDDGFYFGAQFDAADVVDGGTGALDQIGLQGNYAGLTMAAGSMTGVEQLVLLSGTNSNFGDTAGNLYGYNITTHDANIAAGQFLSVTANGLVGGESVAFNAAAELDGSLVYYGGRGTETITGSQQSDGFFFQYSSFGRNDVVDGQGGNLDQLVLQGGFSGSFGAGQLISIEQLVLISSDDVRYPSNSAYNYSITMADGNVAPGASFSVSANMLAIDEPLILTDTAESNAAIIVYSGAGNDQIRLGALGDTVFGGAGNDLIYGNGGGDQLHGGAGNDTFGYLLVTDSTAAAQDHIFDFQSGDHIDLSAIAGFTFVAGGFTAANQVHVTDQGNGNYLVEAETTGDGNADMSILVTSDHALTAADFVGATGASPAAFHPVETPADVFAGAGFDTHGVLAAYVVDPAVNYALNV